MPSMKPGSKKSYGSKLPGGVNPAPGQLPPFAKGGVKVAAPKTGSGRKSL